MRFSIYSVALIAACVFANVALAQVAGFGSATTTSQVPGFGDGKQITLPEQKAVNASEEPSNGSRSRRREDRDDRPRGNDRPRRQPPRPVAALANRPAQSLAAQTDGYVRGLMNQHDKNSDGRLQAEELKNLPSNFARADDNRDEVITFEELRTHVMDLNNNAAGGSNGAQNASAGRSKDRNSSRAPDAGATDKKSVVELPVRFKSRDRDGDGQVAMSEYSRSWTDSLAAEFRRYDKNNDGVITAREAAN